MKYKLILDEWTMKRNLISHLFWFKFAFLLSRFCKSYVLFSTKIPYVADFSSPPPFQGSWARREASGHLCNEVRASHERRNMLSVCTQSLKTRAFYRDIILNPYKLFLWTRKIHKSRIRTPPFGNFFFESIFVKKRNSRPLISWTFFFFTNQKNPAPLVGVRDPLKHELPDRSVPTCVLALM